MIDSLSGDGEMGGGCIVSAPAWVSKRTRYAPPAAPPQQSSSSAAVVFADATNGNDATGDGSLAHPFASVGRALSAVRVSGAGGGTINLRGGGTFYLIAPLELGPADSGLTITTYAGDAEPAWLSGAVPISNVSASAWVRVGNLSANVWAADLSSALPRAARLDNPNVTSLRLAGARLIRARYPNANPETGLPFRTPGASTTASNWSAVAPALPAARWVDSESSRNDSAMRQFGLSINGSGCDLYTPPVSLFCWSDACGGATVSAAQAPHQPYANAAAEGTILTAMHGGLWCTFQYAVGDYAFDGAQGVFNFSAGGQQCGRPESAHGAIVIEGPLEELDEPGEFSFDSASGVLTFWHNASAGTRPPSDGSLSLAALSTLVRVNGSQAAPVVGVSLTRLGFRDTAPAIMGPHLAPSGGDWAVNRNAALTLSGVEGLSVSNCTFWRLDNSGIFIGGYARGVVIQDSEFAWLGESGVVSVGDTDTFCGDGRCGAPITGFPGWGPNASAGNVPSGTQLLRNYAHELGIINKQAAFYFKAVTNASLLQGNIVFNGARSGVNYNDNLGSGSLMHSNVMWGLNRETADHGLFNNWDRLPYYPRKDAEHRDVYIGNLLLANYNSFSGFDTDDASAYHLMLNNVQLYGAFLKSDFSGHDVTFTNTLSIFGSGADQYQRLVAGYFNYIYNCTLLSASEGDYLIQHVCPNATDFPVIEGVTLMSPAGDATVCGVPLSTWQQSIPGVLVNVTAAAFPPTLTPEGIVQMARDTLLAAPGIEGRGW